MENCLSFSITNNQKQVICIKMMIFVSVPLLFLRGLAYLTFYILYIYCIILCTLYLNTFFLHLIYAENLII